MLKGFLVGPELGIGIQFEEHTIVGVYQKYEFAPEQMAALEKWAEFVAGLTRLRRPGEQLAAE
jgi:hypothetical protein